MPSHTENHTVVLTKPALRSLQERAIENNLTTLLASVSNKSLAASGWTLERGEPAWRQTSNQDSSDYNYLYEMFIIVSYTHAGGKLPDKNIFGGIVRKLQGKASTPAFGKWEVTTVDDKPYTPVEGAEDTIVEGYVGYADVVIPDDISPFFSHLYGLENQRDMVLAAIEAGQMSDWTNRMHCVLVGPPACGKSDLASSFKAALGEDAVVVYDSTSLTSAGAIKDLSEREILPRIAIFEEIEKVTSDKAVDFLLGIMDQRAEIRKTTARTNIQREVKMFCIATVNNYEKFLKMLEGALASRFGEPIGFNRPSREQLAMILAREIKAVKGDMRWIEPTLNYCEENGITDTRRIKSICLCGREKLLTGKYQEMLRATSVDRIREIADWTKVDATPEEI